MAWNCDRFASSEVRDLRHGISPGSSTFRHLAPSDFSFSGIYHGVGVSSSFQYFHFSFLAISLFQFTVERSPRMIPIYILVGSFISWDPKLRFHLPLPNVSVFVCPLAGSSLYMHLILTISSAHQYWTILAPSHLHVPYSLIFFRLEMWDLTVEYTFARWISDMSFFSNIAPLRKSHAEIDISGANTDSPIKK